MDLILSNTYMDASIYYKGHEYVLGYQWTKLMDMDMHR